MILEIKNLSKYFDGKEIFANFSYSFPANGLYIIKGESGRGKTTLLRIIAGLDKKISGYVSGGGIQKCSMAFQEYRLFPQLTLLENLLIIRKSWSFEEKEYLIHSLKALGFSESDFGLYPSELSGGMKQRVSILRAVFKESPILLLDEPTKELDPDLVEKIISLIKKEAEKRLVITVTHINAEHLECGSTIINL